MDAASPPDKLVETLEKAAVFPGLDRVIDSTKSVVSKGEGAQGSVDQRWGPE